MSEIFIPGNSESVVEFVKRLIELAIQKQDKVLGKYNTVILVALPNTTPEYLRGYFHGRTSYKLPYGVLTSSDYDRGYTAGQSFNPCE